MQQNQQAYNFQKKPSQLEKTLQNFIKATAKSTAVTAGKNYRVTIILYLFLRNRGIIIRFRRQLRKRKVLGIIHFHCTQWEFSLVLGLWCSYLRNVCLYYLWSCLMFYFIYIQESYFYYFLRKYLIKKEGGQKMYFVIVLARVFQLYAYVPSSNMNDQSTIVHLKNVCVFVDFIFWKVLNALGAEKSLIKVSQCSWA